MNRKLSSATKKADALTGKLGKTSKKTIQPSVSINQEIPGLLEITPETIESTIPQFNPNQYDITNPLAPSETLPQVSEAEFDRGMKIYEGASRALDLTGAAIDLTAKRFSVSGKHAKAIGTGIKVLTAIESTKGDYLEYQTAIEGNKQKATGLSVARHQTVQGEEAAIHLKAELDERLEQAKLRAEAAQTKSLQALSQLNELKNALPVQ
jgi:hypothetical protein